MQSQVQKCRFWGSQGHAPWILLFGLCCAKLRLSVSPQDPEAVDPGSVTCRVEVVPGKGLRVHVSSNKSNIPCLQPFLQTIHISPVNLTLVSDMSSPGSTLGECPSMICMSGSSDEPVPAGSARSTRVRVLAWCVSQWDPSSSHRSHPGVTGPPEPLKRIHLAHLFINFGARSCV